MLSRLTVLASGSSGNATLLTADGFGLLVDCGLPPTELAARLAAVGESWQRVNAVLLTHTHGDHWNRYTLEHLRRLNVTLFAHPLHHAALAEVPAYAPLRRAGLVQDFHPEAPLELAPHLTARPVRVPHDSEPTFAFRFDLGDDAERAWSVGLASDLGRVTDELLDVLHGVDVLAIEFNHCERLERASRRPRFLKDRVLGDFGHLSNRQAGEAVRLLAAADPGGLRAVVQLHLSRECNTAELAAAAGEEALRPHTADGVVVTASQHRPAAPISLTPRGEYRMAGQPPRAPTAARSVQPSLPGLDAGGL